MLFPLGHLFIADSLSIKWGALATAISASTSDSAIEYRYMHTYRRLGVCLLLQDTEGLKVVAFTCHSLCILHYVPFHNLQ